ncbi:cytochrome P450 [Rhizopogon salebrosus TDB-379]|nr:cytochrome P450 [Rhizopogon salebrosus TDB-379]
MDRIFIAACLAALVIVYGVYHRYTRISLANIPGPKSASFILGNLKELYQGQAAEADFKWQAQYGNIVRFRGSFGEDQLMITDPAALHHIFVKSGYRYPKQPDRTIFATLIGGKGILWAEGEHHKRQRTVMQPGFGASECKAFLPLFKGCAESISNKWVDIINNSEKQSAEFNIAPWLSRATLDAIAEAAFDVRFDSVDSNKSALAHAYSDLMADAFGSPSDGQVFVQGILKYIPVRILEYIGETTKNPRITRLREASRIGTSVAKEMVEEKAEMLMQSKGNRDVFSLLVRANMDANAKLKLTKDEMFAEMRTLLLAGHETTSSTITWALFEIARHPEIQSRLRAEIRETEAAIRARGDVDFTVADFDAMPYYTAFMKEVLRFYTVVFHSYRYASQDDVLPLSQPITKISGEVINELPIPKGTRIIASIAAYNRNKDFWGEDAHIFDPERWLSGIAKDKKATSLGVYSNLMTFLVGVRACIGWRFAVIEMQAFLTELVGKFEFTLTDTSARVQRGACLVMAPTLEGEVENGVQMKLRVSAAPRAEVEY